MIEMQKLYLLVPMAPLVGALIAGLFGRLIGTVWSHRITIALMFVCLTASIAVFIAVFPGHLYHGGVSHWMTSGVTR